MEDACRGARRAANNLSSVGRVFFPPAPARGEWPAAAGGPAGGAHRAPAHDPGWCAEVRARLRPAGQRAAARTQPVPAASVAPSPPLASQGASWCQSNARRLGHTPSKDSWRPLAQPPGEETGIKGGRPPGTGALSRPPTRNNPRTHRPRLPPTRQRQPPPTPPPPPPPGLLAAVPAYPPPSRPSRPPSQDKMGRATHRRGAAAALLVAALLVAATVAAAASTATAAAVGNDADAAAAAAVAAAAADHRGHAGVVAAADGGPAGAAAMDDAAADAAAATMGSPTDRQSRSRYYWCGHSWVNAKRCRKPCPSGKDWQCRGYGGRCYAHIFNCNH